MSAIQERHLAMIGLGSNLGDGPSQINEAIHRLEGLGQIIGRSHLVESDPWGFESPHRFTNAVVALQTTLSPMELLDATLEIEIQMGRTSKHRAGEPYTDRVIDVDILTYDRLTLETDRLTLPHPHIQDRDFVREPLNEVLNQLTNTR